MIAFGKKTIVKKYCTITLAAEMDAALCAFPSDVQAELRQIAG